MASLNRNKVFKAAEGYIRANKLPKAIAEFEKWVVANPKDWNTVRQIGDLYARLGRNREAIQKYTQIAEYYQADGFNVRAIATYKMILRLDPRNESAMWRLAELQVAQGLLMEAKSQFQSLIDFYGKSRQRKKAEEVFRKLAAIDPNDLRVRYRYAEFLVSEGKTEEAIGEYIGIADQFINKGKVAEALQILEKGLHIDRTSVALKNKLAHGAILQGDYARAVQLLEEVKRHRPEDVEVLSRLGEAYRQAGNTAEAESVLQKVAALEPDNPEHVGQMAELAMAEGRYDEALDRLTATVDDLVSKGEAETAVSLLQKILNQEPHHVPSLRKLADIHTQLDQESARMSAYDRLCEAYASQGDYEEAVRVAEQLIELDPESSQHKDRLRFLKSKVAGQGQPAEPTPPAAVARDLTESAGGDEITAASLDVGEAFPASLEPEVLVDEGPDAQSMAEREMEPVATLSVEDEEHIKEKLTEAEVFVKYGLVDKAIDQLKDILERFRSHVGAWEKLIEVYREQGMNTEAAEQMMQLALVHEQLGEDDLAVSLRQEAQGLDPTLEQESVTGATAEEEIELTLAPEGEKGGVEDAGVEAVIGMEAGVPEAVDVEEEIARVVEGEPASAGGDTSPIELAESPEAASEGESDISFDEPEEFPVEVEVGGLEASAEMSELQTAEAVLSDEVADEVAAMEAGEGEPELAEEERPAELAEIEVDLGTVDTEAAGTVDQDTQPEVDELGALPGTISPEAEEVSNGISVEIPVAPRDVPADVSEEAVSVPAAEEAAAGAGESAIEPAELAEVDEYVALGLYQDAQDSLAELLRRRPGDELVLAKIQELGFSANLLRKEAGGMEAPLPAEAPQQAPAGEEAVAPTLPPTFPPQPETVDELSQPAVESKAEESFVDWASELSEEMFGTQSAVEGEPLEEPSTGPLTDPGLDEIFREFKKGVEKQLGTEDYDTRYNLGIAYKEMGLLDEAIAEFQLASKDGARLLECCSMLGLCFMEKGMPEIAIKWFEKGLKAPGRKEEEYHGLQYDLAQAYETIGESEQALELYMDIYRVNSRFRDVREKVRDLQAAKQ
ncbi:MAG: tetratricopeptide repeat protein [Acidobacteriota bacterium]